MHPTSVRIIISGHVQGIGFRRFVSRLAGQYKVAGWVKNRDDGSVESLLSGDKASVIQLIADLASPPPGGRVDRIDQFDAIAPEGRQFKVLPD